MFKVGKQYKTRHGEVFTVRYISDNKKSEYPIWAEDENGMMRTFTMSGKFDNGYPDSPCDLILPDDPSALKKDDPIVVKFCKDQQWIARHFSHIDCEGGVHVYSGGRTSWTSCGTSSPEEWRKPTPEEMSKK